MRCGFFYLLVDGYSIFGKPALLDTMSYGNVRPVTGKQDDGKNKKDDR